MTVIKRPIVMIAFLFCLVFSYKMHSETDVKENMEKRNNALDAPGLLHQADSLFSSRKYDESREIYLEAAEKAENEHNNSILTEAYARIARTYLITDRKEQGRSWLEKAAGLADPEEPLGWSRYLGVRGRFEWQDEDTKTSVATFKEMYEYCSQREMHDRAIDAAHMVAIVGTTEEQIEWGKKGIAEAEAGNVTHWLGPLWNNLGWTYESNKEYDKALDAYLQARENHWKYGDEMNKLIADWAVGHTYRLLGDYESALQWLRPVLSWAERIDNAEWIGWADKEIGEAELAVGNIDNALNYLTGAEANLKKAGMADWDPKGLEEIREKIASIRKK